MDNLRKHLLYLLIGSLTMVLGLGIGSEWLVGAAADNATRIEASGLPPSARDRGLSQRTKRAAISQKAYQKLIKMSENGKDIQLEDFNWSFGEQITWLVSLLSNDDLLLLQNTVWNQVTLAFQLKVGTSLNEFVDFELGRRFQGAGIENPLISRYSSYARGWASADAKAAYDYWKKTAPRDTNRLSFLYSNDSKEFFGQGILSGAAQGKALDFQLIRDDLVEDWVADDLEWKYSLQAGINWAQFEDSDELELLPIMRAVVENEPFTDTYRVADLYVRLQLEEIARKRPSAAVKFAQHHPEYASSVLAGLVPEVHERFLGLFDQRWRKIIEAELRKSMGSIELEK